MLACRANQPRRLVEVVAPERIGDDLDRLEPELQAAVDVFSHFVRRPAEGIDGTVGEHPVALALPKQGGEAFAEHFAAQIPERDVDRRNGVDDRAASAVVAGKIIHAIPETLDVAGVAP